MLPEKMIDEKGCRGCPRKCGVNRTMGEKGFCGLDHQVHIGWAGLHFGEEPCFSGTKGVGNFFFSSCNLACVYCQNYQISQELLADRVMSKTEFVATALDWEKKGAHFLGLVTPSHQVPQIRQALVAAKSAGFSLPVIYNSSAYDSVTQLNTLDGLVDIYLPDLKYSDKSMAEKYSNAPNYVSASRNAILEMHKQVGDIQIDKQTGLAIKGLWVRILVLPDNIAGVWESLCFLALEVSTGIGLSIMAQYSPLFMANKYRELSRKILAEEYNKAIAMAQDLGFKNIVTQDLNNAPQNAVPDFADVKKPFKSF